MLIQRFPTIITSSRFYSFLGDPYTPLGSTLALLGFLRIQSTATTFEIGRFQDGLSVLSLIIVDNPELVVSGEELNVERGSIFGSPGLDVITGFGATDLDTEGFGDLFDVVIGGSCVLGEVEAFFKAIEIQVFPPVF